jgi:hypothetical protein
MPISNIMKIALVHCRDLPPFGAPVRFVVEPATIITLARARDLLDHDFE